VLAYLEDAESVPRDSGKTRSLWDRLHLFQIV